MKSANEWSNAFDLSWNNITSNQAPGLSGYEKSYYLTTAQNELVKNWYLALSKGNNTAQGFDDNALRHMDFSSLVRTSIQSPLFGSLPVVNPRALVFELPKADSIVAIISEQLGLAKVAAPSIGNIKTMRQVVPLTQAEYFRLMSKPFKEPLKRQAWRLLSRDNAEVILTSEDLATYPGRMYIVRYVKKPYPIILEDLSVYGSDITIEGSSTVQDPVCELNESSHEAILQRAVELAKISWEGDANMIQLQTASGQRTD